MRPADPRLVTGTPEQIDQARREFRRHQKSRSHVKRAARIPRADLASTGSGRSRTCVRQLLPRHPWRAHRPQVLRGGRYYVTEDSAPIYVERPVGRPEPGRTRSTAGRARARDAAPKKKPAWAKP